MTLRTIDLSAYLKLFVTRGVQVCVYDLIASFVQPLILSREVTIYFRVLIYNATSHSKLREYTLSLILRLRVRYIRLFCTT